MTDEDYYFFKQNMFRHYARMGMRSNDVALITNYIESDAKAALTELRDTKPDEYAMLMEHLVLPDNLMPDG